MKVKYFFLGLKILVIVICVALFMLLMKDVWQKFTSELTNSGTRMRYNKIREKPLPCITFCASQAYKSIGYYFDDKSYRNATFSLEDIFDDWTLSEIKDETAFALNEIETLLLGRCHTICDLTKRVKKDGPKFFLKMGNDLKIFVHLAGEEFWLNGDLNFPINFGSANLILTEQKRFKSAVVGLSEVETTVLDKENEPCQTYAKDPQEIASSFSECCRQALFESIFKDCTIPPMASVILNGTAMIRCPNESMWIKAKQSLMTEFGGIADQPEDYGCPIPCTQTTYIISMEFLHKNVEQVYTNSQVDDDYFCLNLFYDNLNTVQRIENLDYDFGSFLVAAGGNLGLFLGLSCLSFLLAVVGCLEKIASKLIDTK